jgi:peroxiredoxin
MAKVEINNKAVEFSLNDFNGNKISLLDFKDKKNVLVVFNRGFI